MIFAGQVELWSGLKKFVRAARRRVDERAVPPPPLPLPLGRGGGLNKLLWVKTRERKRRGSIPRTIIIPFLRQVFPSTMSNILARAEARWRET